MTASSIWLVHTEKFHRHILPMLTEQGVSVSYICGHPGELRLLEGVSAACLLHSTRETAAGVLPGPRRAVQPDGALLAALEPGEAVTLQLMDRLNYGKLAVNELHRLYLRYLGMWLALIAERAPAAIVFQSTPHMGYDYALYILAIHLGIPTLVIDRTYLPDRMVMTERYDQMPAPPAFGPVMPRPGDDGRGTSVIKANYYDKRNSEFTRHADRFGRIDFWRSAAGRIGGGLLGMVTERTRLLRRFESNLFSFYARPPLRAWYRWRVVVEGIRRDSWRVLYDRATAPPDPQQPFVYFPLQFQPERTSVPMGGVFADQLFTLQTIVDALPAGWQVYVKEHPRQFADNPVRTQVARSRGFYEALAAFPADKVRLMPITTDSRGLIAGSRVVATVAGTAGWEAVSTGVPAMVFGTPWYVNSPGIFKVQSRAECAQVLALAEAGRLTADQQSVAVYIRWMEEHGTFRGYFDDVFEAPSSLSRVENARSYAAAIAAAARRLTAPRSRAGSA